MSHLTKYVENDLTRLLQQRISEHDARVLMPEGDPTALIFFTELGREELCRKIGGGVQPGCMERSSGKIMAHITDLIEALGLNVTQAIEMAKANVAAPGNKSQGHGR